MILSVLKSLRTYLRGQATSVGLVPRVPPGSIKRGWVDVLTHPSLTFPLVTLDAPQMDFESPNPGRINYDADIVIWVYSLDGADPEAAFDAVWTILHDDTTPSHDVGLMVALAAVPGYQDGRGGFRAISWRRGVEATGVRQQGGFVYGFSILGKLDAAVTTGVINL